MHSTPVAMLRTTLVRTLAAVALVVVAGAASPVPGSSAHAGRSTADAGTPALGRITCLPCRHLIPPQLLTTHYDWDGYREADVFGNNFTPDTWMQFVITDQVTGEQVATALRWSGDNGTLTSYPGSGIPPENGAAIFNLPLDGCGGYGRDGLDIQAYDPVANRWSNVLYFNAACL